VEAIIFVTFPLASLVIVLFLLWNDMMRRRRSPRALYIGRSLLCLLMVGVLSYNWFTWRDLVNGAPWLFMVLAIIVSVVAAIFFLLRGIHGDQRRFPDDEPLPSVFSSGATGQDAHHEISPESDRDD
jgi:hypothetical protein